MAVRDPEDRLREEYFRLLPDMLQISGRLKTQVEYTLLPVVRTLASHESVAVKVRVKDCVSAIDKLRRKQESGIFYSEIDESYSLLSVRDLVGIRVLAFPPGRVVEVDSLLRSLFPGWKSDSAWMFDSDTGDASPQRAFKYNGFHEGSPIPCEYQVVSTLTGLFWEVEHAAIYKQAPNFKGLEPMMRNETDAVYRALHAFEDEFERKIRESQHSDPTSSTKF